MWNIVTIWKEVRGELSGMDLSGLDLTGFTLNGVRCSRYYQNSYLGTVFDEARLHEQNLLPQGHTNYVNSAVYSPDGQKILSASWDGTSKVWDVTSGKCLQTFQEEDSPTFPDFPPPKGNQKLKTYGNKIIVPNPSGKGTERTLINVPGLFIQGCSFKNLDQGCHWTEKGLKILWMYGGKTGS